MRSRVIPGSSVTIERRVPVSRLKIVDLPTLGRPIITTDGSFSVIFKSRHSADTTNPRRGFGSFHSNLPGVETEAVGYAIPSLIQCGWLPKPKSSGEKFDSRMKQ